MFGFYRLFFIKIHTYRAPVSEILCTSGIGLEHGNIAHVVLDVHPGAPVEEEPADVGVTVLGGIVEGSVFQCPRCSGH